MMTRMWKDKPTRATWPNGHACQYFSMVKGGGRGEVLDEKKIMGDREPIAVPANLYNVHIQVGRGKYMYCSKSPP